MAEEQNAKKVVVRKTVVNNNNAAGAGYGLGLIGALVYFIQTAVTFWDGVLGVLKALVWPAFLVYEILEFLGI